MRAFSCQAVVLTKADVPCAVRIFARWRITEDVRKYAAEQGITEEAAIRQGLEQKATEFTKSGAEIYAKT